MEELNYQLQPAGKWFDIFYPGNSFEGIFEFLFDESLGQPNDMYGATYTNDYYIAGTYARMNLIPEFSKEIVRGDGSIRSTDYKIWKFCGAASDGRTVRPGSDNQSCNWIVYRLADVLLMKAEALSQLGQYEEALELVNQIRGRALMPAISAASAPEAFEDLILNERARELAFEGKRWFDLLRMGRRNDYARKDKLIQIIIEKVPATQKLILGYKLSNPWGWYFPIYEKELERNNNLVQNPFYADYVSEQ